jgi:hypothetical protein
MGAIGLEKKDHNGLVTACWAAGLFVLCLAIFWPILHLPIGGDKAVYGYIGDLMTQGAAPYKEAWDVKSPGIFFQYAAAFLVFGRGELAANIVDLLFVTATLGVLLAIGRRVSLAAGVIAALSYIASYLLYTTSGWNGQPETPAAFFISALVWLALREGNLTPLCSLAGGVAIAALLWYKTPFLLYGALLIPKLLRTSREDGVLRAFGPALGAFCVVSAAFVGYFLAKGAWQDFYEAAVLFPLALAKWDKGPLLAQAGKFLSGLSNVAFGAHGVTVLALCGLAWMWRKARKHFWLGVTTLGMTAVLVFVQGRYFAYHWIPALPAVAILAGGGAEALMRAFQKYFSWNPGRFCLLVALTLSFSLPYSLDYWRMYADTVLITGRQRDYLAKLRTNFRSPGKRLMADEAADIASYLQRSTAPTDTVLSFAIAPELNFYARRRSPSRFLYLWTLRVKELANPAWVREFADSVIKKRPARIVVCRSYRTSAGYRDYLPVLKSWPRLGRWFEENYALERKVGVVELYGPRKLQSPSAAVDEGQIR